MVSPYYPNQVPWTDKKDWVSPENPGDLVEADHVNQLYAEVNAIGQDVGSHKSEKATQTEYGHIRLADIPASPVTSVAGKTGEVTLTKSDVGLGNVDNAKQMPIAGGTFTGQAKAQNNTAYTTFQIRNIVLSTGNPSGGGNGDIWLKYQ